MNYKLSKEEKKVIKNVVYEVLGECVYRIIGLILLLATGFAVIAFIHHAGYCDAQREINGTSTRLLGVNC